MSTIQNCINFVNKFCSPQKKLALQLHGSKTSLLRCQQRIAIMHHKSTPTITISQLIQLPNYYLQQLWLDSGSEMCSYLKFVLVKLINTITSFVVDENIALLVQ